MGKVFAILLIVFAVWIGLSIFTEGTDRAFGGLLSRFAGVPRLGPRRDKTSAAAALRISEDRASGCCRP